MILNAKEDGSRGATPDLIDTQYESDYATMKFKGEPIADRPRAMTASMYVSSKDTPMLDQLHKNDLLHRSMTALQDSFEQRQNASPTTADGFLTASVSFYDKSSTFLSPSILLACWFKLHMLLLFRINNVLLCKWELSASILY